MKNNDKKKFCILILARGGSKGIKNKNLVPVNGKPLLSYVLSAALDFTKETYVSSDSIKILDFAKDMGAKTVLRSESTSQDNSLDFESFVEFIADKNQYDYIIHLRATFPLINVDIINDANNFFIDNYDHVDSMRSVIPASQNPYKMWHMKDNTRLLHTVIPDNDLHSHPRQLIPASYMQNACIDIVKKDTLLTYNNMVGNNCLGYVMDKKFCIDIDSLQDLKEAENALCIRNGK